VKPSVCDTSTINPSWPTYMQTHLFGVYGERILQLEFINRPPYLGEQ